MKIHYFPGDIEAASDPAGAPETTDFGDVASADASAVSGDAAPASGTASCSAVAAASAAAAFARMIPLSAQCFCFQT